MLLEDRAREDGQGEDGTGDTRADDSDCERGVGHYFGSKEIDAFATLV